MNENELRALARRYAEATSYGDGEDPYLDFAEARALEVLVWLNRGFCIVEKSKVLKEYAETHPEDWDRDLSYFQRELMLHRLFGEELFNEN